MLRIIKPDHIIDRTHRRNRLTRTEWAMLLGFVLGTTAANVAWAVLS